MIGRIKSRIRRSGSGQSQDSLNDSSTRSRTVSSPSSAQERRPDFNAKLTDLTSFDACVETCDALAASSGTYLPGASVDDDTGMVDCSVIVSPDGDLILMMQTQEEKEQQAQQADEDDNTGGLISSEYTESTHTFETNMRRRSSVDHSSSSVVMGNDLQSDKKVNGFSAMGWSVAAASLSIRQTEQTLRTTEAFCLTAQQSQLQAQQQRLVACQTLKTTAGIGEYMRQGAFPPTPVPASFKKKVRNAKVDLQSLSDLEPVGSSWKNNFGGNSVELAPHRVGPLLYSGSTLYGALIATEQYYSKIPVPTPEVANNLCQAADHTAERAYHREKALKEMQHKANDCETTLQYCKLQAARRWELVHQAEENVTRIVESRMLERSKARERQRMAELQAQQSEMEKHSVEFATESEIWDIVNAATKNMEDGDFTPLDLPAAPMGGVMDQSGRSGSNGMSTPPPASPSNSSSTPMASRGEIEQECNLPGLRASALAADEAIEDAAQILLNHLSTLDTTRRSARVAGEATLLSACNSQADSLQRLVQVERRALEERLANLEQLEKVVAEIDVRQDLNTYIQADKKERGGSTWMGDYDDGGVASALAILSAHVEGSTGMGPGSPTSKWAEEIDEEMSPEMLEDSINEIFDTELNGSDEKNSAFEATIETLCRVAAGRKNKSKRSTLCYALNAKRTSAEITDRRNFDGLCRVFDAILSGCDHEAGGVANAKMCMMLSQTFYIIDDDATSPSDDAPDSASDNERSNRVYVKTTLIGHSLWGENDFWDQALNQCVTESLTHSGVMQNFDRADRRNSNRSEWAQTRKLRWFDLTHAERSEAASQVHAVVFAQLGALAHSMMEFGCGIERSCAFVRRMSVRNQLPISQRTMLLQHLIGKKSEIQE